MARRAVIPTMATGASDSVYTNAAGMPSYGVSGIAIETDNVRAHGKDERLPIGVLLSRRQLYYQLMRMLSGASSLSDGPYTLGIRCRPSGLAHRPALDPPARSSHP